MNLSGRAEGSDSVGQGVMALGFVREEAKSDRSLLEGAKRNPIDRACFCETLCRLSKQ
jgi:hypothetical protein